MEAWKRFELSGKVEDYLAYCRDTAKEPNTGVNRYDTVHDSGIRTGGSYGTAGESNRDCAFGYKCR